jgi:hypothetical protein
MTKGEETRLRNLIGKKMTSKLSPIELKFFVRLTEKKKQESIAARPAKAA